MLKTYRITYTDGCYPPEVIGSVIVRGYDRAHAVERFHEADSFGFGIAKIETVRTSGGVTRRRASSRPVEGGDDAGA